MAKYNPNARNNDFDHIFYSNLYPEIKGKTEKACLLHYIESGKWEYRFPNILEKLYFDLTGQRRNLKIFDPWPYVCKYQDLQDHVRRIHGETFMSYVCDPFNPSYRMIRKTLVHHWLQYGRFEGRTI